MDEKTANEEMHKIIDWTLREEDKCWAKLKKQGITSLGLDGETEEMKKIRIESKRRFKELQDKILK